MTDRSTPARSSAASAMCPGFGDAWRIRAHPTWLRAQYRRRASSPDRNSAIVIGLRAGEFGPR